MNKQPYLVRWEINTMAETPEEAAQEIFSECFRPGCDATIFNVEPEDGSTGVVLVDVAVAELSEAL